MHTSCKCLKCGILLLLSTFVILPASGQRMARVIYTERMSSDGLWHYDYTIHNDLDPLLFPDYNLYSVTYDFDPIAEVTVGALPVRWSSILDFDRIETFATRLGRPPLGSEIPPYTSLSGSRLLFDYQAGAIPFTALFIRPNDFANPLIFRGTTAPLQSLYVDKNYTGVETGTETQPYNTLQEALAAASSTGLAHIYIRAHNYNEFPTINKPVKLLNWGDVGTVRIAVP